MNRKCRGAFRTRFVAILAVLAMIGVFLWTVLGRRQSALDQWMAQMRVKGEKLTLAELGLNRPARTNAAMEVIEIAAKRLKALDRTKISGQFQRTEEVGSAFKSVAWAETNLQSVMGRVLGWETLRRELPPLRPVVALT
ncbi:MAG TPA: hypothetical protein VN887_12565 [Candidatus Angelobacter sp.]|nr:hypothetical protein [Candidatus Angelobacter sp.]